MLTKEDDPRVFAVCMGFDAMRMAMGKKTVNFTPQQVVRWLTELSGMGDR